VPNGPPRFLWSRRFAGARLCPAGGCLFMVGTLIANEIGSPSTFFTAMNVDSFSAEA
jgi:hypothetical protein